MKRIISSLQTVAMIFVLVLSNLAYADEPKELLSTSLATAFGSQPDLWGARLSPDGTRISFIQFAPEGTTIARVYNPVTNEVVSIMSGTNDKLNIQWCQWANNDRLLCSLKVLKFMQGMPISFTRLVAVNADATEIKVLLERQLGNSGVSQFQDSIIDWLPDEPNHVLVQTPEGSGSGVGRLDINKGRASKHEQKRPNVYTWISDGRGEARLYQFTNRKYQRWYVRSSAEASWEKLSEVELTASGAVDNAFNPAGFGEDANELLILQDYEGRAALFGMDLAKNNKERLIFSHPEVDVMGLFRLGKNKRVVAAVYLEESPKLHFFDETIAIIQGRLESTFPDSNVNIIDESWDQRYYLVYVGSDTNSGEYYRFDSEQTALAAIIKSNSKLDDVVLQPMQSISYPAQDGVEIPAYLTLPEENKKNLPTIILPHGGPSARDYADYNFLTQFLAANGYAVLQSNYRGSDGYGNDWEGDGAFKEWRQAIRDITDGAQYLVNEGIADPERICTVGWSYGGYAALMSVIEEHEKYQCVVSIAGVTDPKKLGQGMMRFVGGITALQFIGTDDEVVKAGSPLFRAKEINVPALLFHPKMDINVPFSQTKSLAAKLKKIDKEVEFIEYENAEHSIVPERYRIDLLTRLGAFLEVNLK